MSEFVNKKILVVEDDSVNQDIFAEIFEADFDIKMVSDGQQALDVIENFMPSVVLLDIMMAGMDGYEVCRHIRANKKLKHINIIMVSARAMESERIKGLESGADDYITKPFDEDVLLGKVRASLN